MTTKSCLPLTALKIQLRKIEIHFLVLIGNMEVELPGYKYLAVS